LSSNFRRKKEGRKGRGERGRRGGGREEDRDHFPIETSPK
jgi:hypothetical protein